MTAPACSWHQPPDGRWPPGSLPAGDPRWSPASGSPGSTSRNPDRGGTLARPATATRLTPTRVGCLDAGTGWRMLSRGKSEVAANHVREASPPRFGAAAVMAVSAGTVGRVARERPDLSRCSDPWVRRHDDRWGASRKARPLTLFGPSRRPGGGYAKEPAATPPRLIGGQAHARRP